MAHPLRYLSFSPNIDRHLTAMWTIGQSNTTRRRTINIKLWNKHQDINFSLMADLLKELYGGKLFVFSSSGLNDQIAVVQNTNIRMVTNFTLGLVLMLKLHADKLDDENKTLLADMQTIVNKEQAPPQEFDENHDFLVMMDDQEQMFLPNAHPINSLTLNEDYSSLADDNTDTDSQNLPLLPVNFIIPPFLRPVSPESDAHPVPGPDLPRPYDDPVPDPIPDRDTNSEDSSQSEDALPTIVRRYRNRPRFISDLKTMENERQEKQLVPLFEDDIFRSRKSLKRKIKKKAANQALPRQALRDFAPVVLTNNDENLFVGLRDLFSIDSDDDTSARVPTTDDSGTENVSYTPPPTPVDLPEIPDVEAPSPVRLQVGQDYTPYSKLSLMHAIGGMVQNQNTPLKFSQIAPPATTTRHEASFAFAQLLEMNKMGYTDLEQPEDSLGYGDIQISPTDKFDKNVPRPVLD